MNRSATGKRSHRLIRNSLYNFLGQVWFLVLHFVTIPYTVSKLGVDAYGILAIVTTVIGYFGFLNLGLGTAIVKYISEFYAKKDFNMINKTMGMAFLVYCIMGVLGAVLLLSLTGVLVSTVLKVPAGLHGVAYSVFYISAIGFFVNMVLNVFSSIPNALQRFDVSNKLGIVFGSLQTILTVVLLFLGYMLKEVVIMSVFISVLNIIVLVVIVKKLMPELRLRPHYDRGMLLRLLKFGGFISISRLTSTLANCFDKFIIGAFLPVSFVTYYTVPKNLAQKLLLIPDNITSILLPAASELDSLKNRQVLKELYLRSNKFITLLVTPLTVLLIVFAKEVLTFWLGVEFATRATSVLQILSVSALVGTIGWPSGTVAQALGRPDIPALIGFLQAVTNIVLCFVLIPRMGINGAAMALLLNFLLLMPLLMFMTTRLKLHTSFWELCSKSFLKPMVVGFLVAVLAIFSKSYIKTPVHFVATLLVLGLLCVVISYIFILDRRDKAIILDYIR